jgi:hypothetical protein
VAATREHSARCSSMGLTRFPSLQRWTALTLVALAALSTLFAAGLTFRRATTPWARLPDHDYWDNISGIITEAGVKLELQTLFRHNNEHIVLIPKLIYAANYLATSGSNIGLIIYSIFIGALCSAILVLLAKDVLIDTPLRFALCALLFPLVMFSSKLTHNYFMGMSGTMWLTADLFVIVSAVALARAVTTASSVWLLTSIGAALLGVLSYSTAIFALLILLFFGLALLIVPKLRGIIPRPMLVATVVLIALVLGVGLIYRNQPPQHPAWVFDPMQLVHFVLVYIGSLLPINYIGSLLPIKRGLEAVGGLVVLTVGVASISYLVVQGRTKEILVWIILFLFAPFNALMTGIGRLGFGMAAAASSRYQSVAALTLIATITLALAALPKGPASRLLAAVRAMSLGALLLLAPLIVIDRSYLKDYSARNEKKVIAEIALRQGIQGDDHIKAATPATEQLDRLIPVLRAAHHVPFDRSSRCEEMLGQHIPDTVGLTAGLVETLSTYEMSHGAGRAIELSGWAERNRAAAECIIIVDGSGTVIGSGASVSRRADLELAKGRTLGLVGWKAVAALPQSMPVCAFALFPGETQWTPLSKCHDKIESSG